MDHPDELNEEQLARLEAEEAIQDDLVEYIPLISRDVHESNAMIAEIIELALFNNHGDLSNSQFAFHSAHVVHDLVRLKEIQDKCLKWFDMMIERKVHGKPDENNSGLATESVKRLVETVRNTTIDEILKEIDEPMDQFAIWEIIKGMRSNI